MSGQKDSVSGLPWESGTGLVFKQVISRSDTSILYKVHQLPDTTNFYACMKITKPQNMNLSDLEENLKAVQKLLHPHTIKCHRVFTLHEVVYTVLDYFPQGSINDLLRSLKKPLPLKLTRVWFGQVLGALDYIHTRGMAHRNIKLTKKLILFEEHIVLSGFVYNCLAYRRDVDIMRTTVIAANLAYRAPEAHSICSQVWPYDAKAGDMYAMGVCLFQMVNLTRPYDEKLFEKDQYAYIEKQRKRDYTFNSRFAAHCNEKVKHLIFLLLEPKPGVRTSAKGALVHAALLPE